MRRAIIVVAAADQAQANTDAAQIDASGGDRTFTVGLVAADDSAGPITHYWCSWMVTQEQWDALAALFDGVGSRRMFDGGQMTSDAVLAACGLARPPGDE